MGSDYLFSDCSQRAVSRFGCGKPSVIKQTLEMQSEDNSTTRDPLKQGVLSQGCLGELVIKGPRQIDGTRYPRVETLEPNSAKRALIG
jgi:hypothetical protein